MPRRKKLEITIGPSVYRRGLKRVARELTQEHMRGIGPEDEVSMNDLLEAVVERLQPSLQGLPPEIEPVKWAKELVRTTVKNAYRDLGFGAFPPVHENGYALTGRAWLVTHEVDDVTNLSPERRARMVHLYRNRADFSKMAAGRVTAKAKNDESIARRLERVVVAA